MRPTMPPKLLFIVHFLLFIFSDAACRAPIFWPPAPYSIGVKVEKFGYNRINWQKVGLRCHKH